MVVFLRRLVIFLPVIIKIIMLIIEVFEENENINKDNKLATKPSSKTK